MNDLEYKLYWLRSVTTSLFVNIKITMRQAGSYLYVALKCIVITTMFFLVRSPSPHFFRYSTQDPEIFRLGIRRAVKAIKNAIGPKVPNLLSKCIC